MGCSGLPIASVVFALHSLFGMARDPILKERLFGLTGSEGNHGEDVKELYYYLDSTPTHSYMKALYKYPQAESSVCAVWSRKIVPARVWGATEFLRSTVELFG